MKKISILFVCLSMTFMSCSELLKVASTALTPSNLEIASGLKQALNQGLFKGIQILGNRKALMEGEYKFLLPKDVQPLVEAVRVVPGFQDFEQQVVGKVATASSEAITIAKPIFQDAIKKMTFGDAMGILMGDKDAATQYLRRATTESLMTAFKPIVRKSLDDAGIGSEWNQALNIYNALPFKDKKIHADLESMVAHHAMNGLFNMIKKEEANVRKDISFRTTDLMKRVFALQDNRM